MIPLTKLEWNGKTARESLTCDYDLLSYLSSWKEGMIHFLYGFYIWLFCVIDRETRVMNKYILIGCRISARLPVKSMLFENKMADKSRVSVYNEDEYSCALDEALSYFKHNSLKAEQKECLRSIICLHEDVLAFLPANLHCFIQ